MTIPSARQKHVEVRLVLRKSLKRRSKRTKKQRHKNKTTQVARSLITPSLLQESVRFKHVSVFRNPTLSTQKIAKKQKQNPTDIQIIHQQQIYDSENQHDVSQYAKSNSNNDHNLESSSGPINNTNLTGEKIVLPTSRLLLCDQADHRIQLSLHQSNKKEVTTTKVSSSLIIKRFSSIIRWNTKSSVHPNDKEKKRCSPWVFALSSIVLALFIAGIILAIVLSLNMGKSTTMTSTIASVSTTTPTPVCTTSAHVACSSSMYYNLNVLYNSPSSWTSISCCYIAPTINQLTIEFAMQEDDFGYWMVDDISATQGQVELVTNGGFEYNMTNWTLTVYSNATSSIAADNQSGSQHTGNAYLYGASANALSYVKQTFPIVQGQNVLISFWLYYTAGLGVSYGTSEFIATLT